jgi:hypothetical protein
MHMCGCACTLGLYEKDINSHLWLPLRLYATGSKGTMEFYSAHLSIGDMLQHASKPAHEHTHVHTHTHSLSKRLIVLMVPGT